MTRKEELQNVGEFTYSYTTTDASGDVVKFEAYNEGTSTKAKLTKNGKFMGEATARLHPEDTFDFKEGMQVAFDKLCNKYANKISNEPTKKEAEHFIFKGQDLGEMGEVLDYSLFDKEDIDLVDWDSEPRIGDKVCLFWSDDTKDSVLQQGTLGFYKGRVVIARGNKILYCSARNMKDIELHQDF